MDDEMLKRLAIYYEKIISLRKDSDYEINPPQIDKLLKLIDFYIEMAEQLHGEVEPVKLSPREQFGDVVAKFIVFDLSGDEVQRFCDVMRACSAFGIDVTSDDKVQLSCTVPNVFIPR